MGRKGDLQVTIPLKNFKSLSQTVERGDRFKERNTGRDREFVIVAKEYGPDMSITYFTNPVGERKFGQKRYSRVHEETLRSMYTRIFTAPRTPVVLVLPEDTDTIYMIIEEK